MKSKFLLSLLFLSTCLIGFSTVVVVNNSGLTFSPSTITINFGDSVNFVIASSHNATEVDQTVWNANGNTALSGGFLTSFGGGMILPGQLAVGTHYFVCTPHASSGMKGTIVVQSPTGISKNVQSSAISIFPNPSNGMFQIEMEDFNDANKCKIEVFNILGAIIFQTEIKSLKFEIDLSNNLKGVYFIKIYDGITIRTKKVIIK